MRNELHLAILLRLKIDGIYTTGSDVKSHDGNFHGFIEA
jgi:hypothetical protein